jgi:ribosomal-protein-alanine N-acetyltransferase
VNVVTRAALPSDLDEIARIQSASPGATSWKAADFLAHQCLVALAEGRVVGFIACRRTAADESEILNLAVDPQFRRRGVARQLVEQVLESAGGALFLEVRESNHAARKLYESMGFQVIALRKNYYNEPVESAIVMKFHSC